MKNLFKPQFLIDVYAHSDLDHCVTDLIHLIFQFEANEIHFFYF